MTIRRPPRFGTHAASKTASACPRSVVASRSAFFEKRTPPAVSFFFRNGNVLATPSPPAVTSFVPSREKRTRFTCAPACGASRTSRHRQTRVSHRRTVPSSDPVARVDVFEQKSTPTTSSSWPVNVATQETERVSPFAVPRRSHTLHVLSKETDATSALGSCPKKQAPYAASAWPTAVETRVADATSQNTTAPLSVAAASEAGATGESPLSCEKKLFSVSNATPFTSPSFPRRHATQGKAVLGLFGLFFFSLFTEEKGSDKSPRQSPDASHSRAEPSPDAVAKNAGLMGDENAHAYKPAACPRSVCVAHRSTRRCFCFVTASQSSKSVKTCTCASPSQPAVATAKEPTETRSPFFLPS